MGKLPLDHVAELYFNWKAASISQHTVERERTQIRLEDIVQKLNPILQGWLNYYGHFCPTAMDPMWRYTNGTLVAWTMRKYKRYAGRKIRASQLIRSIAIKRPKLFVHWHQSSVGAFA
jgi:RNA-directed DNA polymerase